MFDYVIKRPMLLSGLLCVLIAVAGYYYMPSILVIGILLALGLGVLIYKKVRGVVLFAFFTAFIMLLSMIFTCGKIQKLQTNTGKTYNLKCTVNNVTYEGENYNRAIVEVIEKGKLPKGTKISVGYSDAYLKMGQTFKADIKITEITDEYKKNNYSNSVYLNGSMKNIEITNKGDFVLSAVRNVREYIRKMLFNNLDYKEASTLCALIFGDRSYFSDEFYNNVKAAGVSHIMVVSGMHLAIIISIILNAVESFIYNKYLKAVAIVAVVLLLTALCGFTMSMLRAGITYLFMALSLILNRKGTPENTLGTAVTTLLIFSPFAIFSVAYQLSVLSTFGILVIAMPIVNFIRETKIIKSKIVFWLFSCILLTLSAMLTTLPIAIYVFGYVSTVSLFSNLLIAPVIEYVLMMSLLALAVSLISTSISAVLFMPLDVTVKYINGVINFFGSLKWAVAELPSHISIIAAILIIIIFWDLIACKKYFYVVKLIEIREKIKKEGGKRLKWQ